MSNRINYNRKHYRKHSNSIIKLNKLKVSFFICMIIFICFAAIQGVNATNSVKSVDKQYRSVLIEDGDTLWDIAGIHNDQSLSAMSNKEYIKEIESINKISSDNIIAGNYIIVPVFIAGSEK